MNLRTFSLVVLSVLVFRQPVCAQVNVELQFQRSTFLLDEHAIATLRFTNMSGRDLTLGEQTKDGPWCQIQVSSVRGETPIPRKDGPQFPPLSMKAGETVARTVDVTDVYEMSLPGQYRVKASISPGQGRNQIVTAPVYINTDPGKTTWSTTVGVPEDKAAGGSVRTFSLIQLQRKEGIFLYAKLEDKEAGWRYPPYLLGRMLSAMQPQAQTDRDNNLYVLHAVDDESYLLTQIDVSSGQSGQAVYRSKTPRNGRPSLQRNPDGRLVIAGGIRVNDAELSPRAAPERSKLSDRPAGF